MQFKWTAKRVKAAELSAEDKLTDEKIAKLVGVARDTLTRWKRRPEFKAKVKEITGAIEEVIIKEGIERREKRIAALNERWQKCCQVIDERAEDPGVQNAPGGKTGFVVRQQKMIGSGAAAVPIEEFSVDIALLKELREIEKQTAVEVGQWAEKHEHSSPPDKPINVKHEHIIGELEPYLDVLRGVASRSLNGEAPEGVERNGSS